MKLNPRQLQRAALQRLSAAEALLEWEPVAEPKRRWNFNLNLDAVYLAGYGAECALKALLLARTPEKKQADVIQSYFRGRQGHNLDMFKELLQQVGCPMSREVAEQFRRVVGWSTDLRYEVGRKPYKDAKRFFDAALAVCRWSEVRA